MQYHISLSASFLWSLKKFAIVNKKRNNKFLYFSDNLTFWPFKNIFEEDFLMQRSKWIYENMYERDLFRIHCEFVNPEEAPRKE